MKKVRLFVWGDAVAETGFGRVLHSIMENLPKDKYDISWLGVNYDGDPHPYPYRIYPAASEGDMYGINRAKEILEREKPEIIFLLNDIWITMHFLELLKKTYTAEEMPKIVIYFPVDSLEHNPYWYKDIDITTSVVYNNFGLSVAKQASPETNFKIIPHGVDKTKFFKINAPKSELRKLIIGDTDQFAESFVVLNGNRNQPRKRLDATIRGFAIFAHNNPTADVVLHMHCGLKDASIDVPLLAKRYGINDNIIVAKYNGIQKLTVEQLNILYNLSDIGINTSLGEGFGLVNVEHAITGAAQIVPNHSACKDLFYDCGILMPVSFTWVQDKINTVGGVVTAETVAESIQLLYDHKAYRKRLADKAIEKFSSGVFSWQKIADMWDTLFMEVTNNV